MNRQIFFPAATWLLLAGLLMPSLAGAGEFSTYRGDKERTGGTEQALSLPLKPAWISQAPTAPRLAWSSAEGRVMEHKLIGARIRFDDAFRTVIADQKVYFGSTVDHQVHCLDLASGQTQWTFFTGGPVRLAPTVSGDKLLFGSDDGYVYCLHKDSGTLIWKRLVGPHEEWLLARGEMISKWPVRTGVLVHEGVAYYGAGTFPHEDVFLEGVEVETGKRLWRADNLSAQDAGRDDLSPQGYLLASENYLFVPSGGSLPAAFDRKTGQLVHKRNFSWRTTAGGVVGGSRAVLADGQLYASGPHHFLAMDEASGDTGFAWIDGRQMAVQDQQAYVVTGTHLRRLDRNPYAVASRERHKLSLDVYSARRSLGSAKGKAKEKLQATIEEAEKRLSELESVGVDWQVEMADDFALLVCAEHVLVGGPDRVTIYQKDDGAEVAQLAVDGEARGLSVVDGYLLVSTDTGQVICFGSQAPQATEAPTRHWQGGSVPDQPLPDNLTEMASGILRHSGVGSGYAIVMGTQQGDLPLALARRSELKIYCVEADPEKAERARERLSEVGLYGHRVVVHSWPDDQIPYANYFADLMVSETAIDDDGNWASLPSITRHLKPLGGTICVAVSAADENQDPQHWQNRLQSLDIADQSRQELREGYAVLIRGALPGAGNWSHQYGNPDNTAVSREMRVAGDLGVLWYGDPGPDQMVNRHDGAVGPLAIDGRLIVQGEWSIMAYDAYNGRHLWTVDNPEAIRTGVFQNQNPGNIAAASQGVFHFWGDQCYQLDLETGQQLATHLLPKDARGGEHQWGYLAIHEGILFGTATKRTEIESKKRRRGRATEDATDSIFAIDLASGQHLWSYQGSSISHHTIAIGDGKVCFIDSSITSEQRAERLRQSKEGLAELTGEAKQQAERRLKAADLRMAIALHASNGNKLWEQPVDVTDCSEIGIGGGKLTMLLADGKLVLCGANANGHYWKQFIEGEFKQRRIVVLSAEDGYQQWARDANYLHRPIVIGKQLLAEPWKYDLDTGEQITRMHPITGQTEPWTMMRTGHHCGMVTGCDSGMLLFRSGFTAFADLNQDDGIRHFSGHRLGCWINAIAANGLVMIPEAAAGCVCQFSLASTIVLEPRPARRPWTVFSAVGEQLPVKRLAVNFGAPGDRKDALGNIWLAYPRYVPYKKTSLELDFDLKVQFLPDQSLPNLRRSSTLASGGVAAQGYGNVSPLAVPAIAAETDWIYHSWVENLQSLELPLTNDSSDVGRYHLRFHFATLDASGDTDDEFVLTVRTSADSQAQKVVLPKSSPSDPLEPLVIEFPDLQVAGSVQVEFAVSSGSPRLNAIEAVRQD